MRLLLILSLAFFAPPVPDKPISLEAEDGKVVKIDTVDWVKVTKPEGFSGSGALMAMPNDNMLNDEDFVEKCPRIDFEVTFPAA